MKDIACVTITLVLLLGAIGGAWAGTYVYYDADGNRVKYLVAPVETNDVARIDRGASKVRATRSATADDRDAYPVRSLPPETPPPTERPLTEK